MEDKLNEALEAVLNALEVAKDSERSDCPELARADVLALFALHDAYRHQRANNRIAKALMGVR